MRFVNYQINPITSALIAVIVFVAVGSCQPQTPSNLSSKRSRDSLPKERLLTKRIFYMCYATAQSTNFKEKMREDNGLSQMGNTKQNQIQEAVDSCENMDCLVEALEVSRHEMQKRVAGLSQFYRAQPTATDYFMNNKIRPSHAFAFYANYSDSALFLEAWKEQWNGLNYIFHAYLQNKGLVYPTIDSAQYDVHSSSYLDTVKQLVGNLVKTTSEDLFFQPLLDIGIRILQLNHRDEAIRFLPLSKVNGQAYHLIPTLSWDDYPFTGILILGSGPGTRDVAISEEGKERCRMGAALYREKKAPLVVVSGGYVHPYQTKYCEAEEMKRYLIDSLHIPEEVIIMEPHARHTTTNIRNTNRIFLKHQIPRNKPILCVTKKYHIDYIVSDRFNEVFKREIGVIPYVGLKRLSDTTASYYPALSSFQVNTLTPLDP